MRKIFLNKLKVKLKLSFLHIYLILLEFLLRSSSDESNNPTTISPTVDDIETHRHQINKLIELGFTEQQARIGLKRTRLISFNIKLNLYCII